MKKASIFISYAHEDRDIADRLVAHLSGQKDVVDIWMDTHLTAGETWHDEIHNKMQEADIFLLLISADAMNSEFIPKEEWPAAEKLALSKKANVIPVYCRECELKPAVNSQHEWLRTFHWPNRDDPISDPGNDTVLSHVTKEVGRIIIKEIKRLNGKSITAPVVNTSSMILSCMNDIQLKHNIHLVNKSIQRKKIDELLYNAGPDCCCKIKVLDGSGKDYSLIKSTEAKIRSESTHHDKVYDWGSGGIETGSKYTYYFNFLPNEGLYNMMLNQVFYFFKNVLMNEDIDLTLQQDQEQYLKETKQRVNHRFTLNLDLDSQDLSAERINALRQWNEFWSDVNADTDYKSLTLIWIRDTPNGAAKTASVIKSIFNRIAESLHSASDSTLSDSDFGFKVEPFPDTGVDEWFEELKGVDLLPQNKDKDRIKKIFEGGKLTYTEFKYKIFTLRNIPNH